MGRRVREVWVRWAEKQPNPKPSWLLNYDAITPAEQDADDCIGMAIWAECFDKFQSEIAELELTKQRLAAAEEAKLDAQDDARAQFGRYMDCDKVYRALQDRLAAAEAERIWTCGCGIVNGVNLATCRVCGRKEGEQC